MAKSTASAKVICFTCRETSCACVSAWNRVVLERRGERAGGELARAAAWLGGACVAGTALGAVLAILFGG
jgi:hypothetical protein